MPYCHPCIQFSYFKFPWFLLLCSDLKRWFLGCTSVKSPDLFVWSLFRRNSFSMAKLGGLVKKTAFTPSSSPILKGRVKKRNISIMFVSKISFWCQYTSVESHDWYVHTFLWAPAFFIRFWQQFYKFRMPTGSVSLSRSVISSNNNNHE